MEISYLADRPDAIAGLVVAFAEEWPAYAAETGHEAIAARFRECLRKDALPLALVGYEGGRLVGTVALLHDSVRSRPALGPWLAALYVAPDARGQGRGTALVRAAERTAGEIGLTGLHAGTSTARSLFERLGWRRVEDLEYDGEALTIYHTVIPARPST